MTASSHSFAVPSAVTPSGLLESWAEGWEIALKSLGDFAGAALTKGLGPLEISRWLALIAERRPPAWTTPHKIVFEAPVGRLRDFSRARPRHPNVVPTLVLPPQAGHDSCIVDYTPEQSQMGAVLAAGLERAISLDWLGATRETADATIDDYLDLIDRAVEYAGGRVNLIGDCQGGWLATVYAALYPERVNTLTLAGAPIDFHAGEPVIHEVLRHLAPAGDLGFYEALVAADGGVLKGEHMLAGFIMINPGDEISRQMELLAHIDDAAHVARYREFENWFKHTQDIPGGFYLWIVRHLFRDNELIAGELEVRGQRVNLGRIEMPLNLLAGATDHITPPDQVFAIASLVGTPPERIVRDVTTGGHLGLFMSHKALHDHWPPLLEGVLEHSL
ncbi:MAG: alpha/beta hydrolase [Solirubrobacterales bacterium]|nr:alpha/beta hydrolase [Solirubrobacterales bacterium]